MDQPRSWGFDCSETAQLEFFVGGFFLLKDLMLGMGIRRIHKEIHGMAPKCFVAAVFLEFRNADVWRTTVVEIGSVKGVVSRSMYDGTQLTATSTHRRAPPQSFALHESFLDFKLFCYTRVVIFGKFFFMCFPPQIGSLLKESIIDLKVQKNNLDMVLVYFDCMCP